MRHEGTNLRMTEMYAAIGLRQLAKLPVWSTARRRNSLIMHDALRDVRFLLARTTPEGHPQYRCVAFVHGDDAAARRNTILGSLHAAGLPDIYGSCVEIYRERLFEQRGFMPATIGRGMLDAYSRLPNARLLGETSLTFPCHRTIDESSMRT